MQTALVTGGCGFVGRHLVRRLLERGDDVWVIDNLSTGQHPDVWLNAKRIAGSPMARYDVGGRTVTFIQEDVTVSMLKQLGTIPGSRPEFPFFDSVFALASIVGGRTKIDGDPLGVGMDLAIDALFFLWLARNKQNIGRVLYASSSAAYPIKLQSDATHLALREHMIDFTSGDLGQPDMTYGWSKLTGEYLAHLAARNYGISIACVRPFSGYGEDQDLTYPVPAIAYRVARGDNPVTVWGTGEQGRDFVHIEDCITCMLLAVERIADGSGVNIGTGKLTTFLEVASLFIDLNGRKASVQAVKGKPVGVQSRYCDPAHMESVLGYRPAISMREGFSRVLQAAHDRVRILGSEAVA